MSFLGSFAASLMEVAEVARRVDRALATIAQALEATQPRSHTAQAVYDERRSHTGPVFDDNVIYSDPDWDREDEVDCPYCCGPHCAD
jgi:hypothetical protein